MRSVARTTSFLFLILAGLAIPMGCSNDSDYKTVDFSRTAPAGAFDQAAPKEDVLRVAVGAMVSPEETFSFYRELIDYIGKKLEYPTQFIQRKTYREINDLFAKKAIEIAFICSGPYVKDKTTYGFQPLVTPIVKGEPFYRSYLIVPKNSVFQNLDDLRNHVFAFTDPDSNSCTLAPKYWLARLHETAGSFFQSVIYTYSHDNSILAVSENLVDGAAVDSHIWDYYQQRNPAVTAGTRIIYTSEPYGSPPLVAAGHLPLQVKESIQTLLLAMHEDPEGRRILGELMNDRFEITQESWYESVGKMRELVETP